MKAAVKTMQGDFEIKEVNIPQPEPGEVLIKIKASGICGSDLHFWKVPISDSRHYAGAGVISGHELCGEVVEVGSKVTNVKVGDRVGVEPLKGCGVCYFCRVGQYHLCPKLGDLRRVFTGFAEYSKGPSNKFYKLPENVSYEEAVLLDGLAVGVHAVHRASLKMYQTAVILGAGTIGLCTLEVAAAGGAKVISTAKYDRQIEVAGKVGAWRVIDIRSEDPRKVVSELTNGMGVDVAFEAVGGDASTIQLGLELVKAKGVVVILGLFTKPQVIDVMKFTWREVDLIGASSYAYWGNVAEFKIALDLLSSGRVDAKSLVTQRFPLERINEGFEAFANKRETGAIKVVLTP